MEILMPKNDVLINKIQKQALHSLLKTNVGVKAIFDVLEKYEQNQSTVTIKKVTDTTGFSFKVIRNSFKELEKHGFGEIFKKKTIGKELAFKWHYDINCLVKTAKVDDIHIKKSLRLVIVSVERSAI
jgi:GTP-sensing pleiotropic transcriptional regulator CodY